MKKNKLLKDECYNRTILKKAIKQDLSNNKKLVLVTSPVDTSYGLTYMMMYLHDDCDDNCIYIDLTSDNNLSRNLYNALKNEHKKITVKIIYEILKISASFLCIIGLPVSNLSFAIGGAVQNFLEASKNLSSDMSLISNLGKADLRIISRRSKKKKFTLIIDNADKIANSYENKTLIKKLLEFNNITIIMGAKTTSEFDKLTFIYNPFDSQMIKYEMPRPDMEYLNGIISKYNQNFTEAQKNEILSREHDVYTISKIIMNYMPYQFADDLTESQKYIVRLVRYAGIPLSENEIIAIASTINISRNQAKKDIDLLTENKYIQQNNNAFTFNKLYEDYFVDNDFYYITAVTDYLFKRYLDNHYSINEIRLQYLIRHLSNRTEQQMENIKLDLLQRSIKQNFTISTDILDSMSFDNDKGNLLLGIIYFNLRKYDKSRYAIQKISSKDKNYKIMNVLLLNRERQYNDTLPGKCDGAISKLKNIIDENNSSDYYALFNAIYAVSLLHANEMSTFDKVVDTILKKSDFDDKTGAGYFYRNIGFSIDKKDKNICMFVKADKIFKAVDDVFGILTNNINMYTYKAISNEFVDESIFKNDISNLIEFGVQHLHVALNNLALYYILRNEPGDPQKAKIEIEKAKTYAYDDMPKVFAGINDALIYVRTNNYCYAYNTICQYEEITKKAKFDRIRQKYYITKAFIAWLNKIPNLSEIISCAESYPERRNNDLTFEIVKLLKTESPENFKQSELTKYIIPAYLEYWYINPLKFIDVNVI